MRQIATLPKARQAMLLTDHLHSLGVGSSFEPARNDDGSNILWVHDEADVDKARIEIERYLASPDDPAWIKSAEKGRAMRKAESKAMRASTRMKVIDARTRLWGNDPLSEKNLPPPITMAIMMVCVLLFSFTEAGHHMPNGPMRSVCNSIESWLLISKTTSIDLKGHWTTPGFRQILPEIFHGQVWRLFTPVLLHANILHIVFNMILFRRFAGAVELQEGPSRLLSLTLVLGVASTLTQYFWAGPLFVGISGVVYGLFGYVWVVGETDPARPYRLDKESITGALIWLIVCMTGIIGPVANAAHLGGLAFGIIWGGLRTRSIPFVHK